MGIVYKYRELFGKKLSALLKQRHISNNQLAQMLEIERSNITQYIKGNTCPKLDIFLSICDLLRVKPEYFLDDSVKFPDYYNLKNKSRSRKVIESIFTLCEAKILTPESSSYMTEFETWNYNVSGYYLLNEIARECEKFANTTLLDEGINFCDKLVNNYEIKLSNFLDNAAL